ncbi:MAG: exodeoxyribonuclease VII large subunit [Candidatus Paceibacteria bacterium]|jgi:exodeoxyribonuclease VII large subunit
MPSYQDPPPQNPAEPQVLKVSDLNQRLRGLFGSLGRIAVEGEVAGLKQAASGHIYFSLKDRLRGVESVLSCAIWRSQVQRAQRQPMREGDRVVAHGKLDLYGPRGSYSLIVERVEPMGLGALLVQLEELKRELAAKGWFERRRELPRMPRMVGVVTSRDGAAFQDFLRTRSLRWPLYPVRLAHTPVQGPGASQEIARAIADLDASGVDLIVLCRGGGSMEDLWAFNERAVAQAIWACSVPVVSGVGHETDVTLADHVADQRAHTPTDAAQLVLPDRQRLEAELERRWNYLVGSMGTLVERRQERLQRLASARVLRGADWILENRVGELQGLGRRLQRSMNRELERSSLRLQGAQRALAAGAPSRRLERDRSRVEALGRRLCVPPRETLSQAQGRLELVASRLEAFSPFSVLGRGYSITRVAGQNQPLTEAEQLEPGTKLETRLASGTLISTFEREES